MYISFNGGAYFTEIFNHEMYSDLGFSFISSLMLNAKLFWEIQLIYRRLFQVTTKIPYVTCCCADKSKLLSEKRGV